MSVVGNNLGRMIPGNTKPQVASRSAESRPAESSSLSKGKAKEGSPSSNSSNDFETFLSKKQERDQKFESLNRPAARRAEGEDRPVFAKSERAPLKEERTSAQTRESQPDALKRSRGSETADAKDSTLPGQPKDLPGRLPERLENSPLRGKLPVEDGKTGAPTDLQAKLQPSTGEDSVDNLVNRQALQQLLKRMKDEFGLDAEQIVQAFSQLTDAELQAPPEMSLDKIIQSLPLSPEQQMMAKGFFQDMLKQTAAQDMAGYLKASSRQLSLEVLSQKEASQRAMTRAVENMQSQFFTQSQPKMQVPANAALSRYQSAKPASEALDWQEMGMQAVGENEQSLYSSDMMNTPMNEQAAAKAPTAKNMGLAATVAASTAAAASELEAAAQSAKSTATAKSAPANSFNSFFTNSMNSAASGASAASSAAQPTSALSSVATKAPEVAPSVPNMNLAAMGLSNGEEANEAGGEDAASSGQSEFGAQFLQNDSKAPGQAQVQGKDGFMINTQPTNGEEAGNIRQAINHAQLLARKGGGEMKMVLAPEGLGEIKMKVAVENGQVNVEMVADSNEAKKLIEKGLGDLKATLMSHNLKVDQIRVETPADVSRQLTQQHDDSQRQFAQQFMEQFRQENNEFRRGFFDMSAARPIESQKDAADRGPVANPSNRRQVGSRRLDLVA